MQMYSYENKTSEAILKEHIKGEWAKWRQDIFKHRATLTHINNMFKMKVMQISY
jgi:hypothetical protein